MDPSRAYYGTDTRASGLLLGGALALVWKPGRTFRRRRRGQDGRPRPRRDGRRRRRSSAASPRSATPTRSSTGRLRRRSSVASCVAIMATVHPGTMLGRPCSACRSLVWVGKRSYSLYLWHWPIFVFTRPQIDQPLSLYPTLVLRLVLTVIAAELSYRFVEVPIRNGAFTPLAPAPGPPPRAPARRTGPIVLAVRRPGCCWSPSTPSAPSRRLVGRWTSSLGQGDDPAGHRRRRPGARRPSRRSADPAAIGHRDDRRHRRDAGVDPWPARSPRRRPPARRPR